MGERRETGFLRGQGFFSSASTDTPDSSHRLLENDRPAPERPYADPSSIRQRQACGVLVERRANHHGEKEVVFLRLEFDDGRQRFVREVLDAVKAPGAKKKITFLERKRPPCSSKPSFLSLARARSLSVRLPPGPLTYESGPARPHRSHLARETPPGYDELGVVAKGRDFVVAIGTSTFSLSVAAEAGLFWAFFLAARRALAQGVRENVHGRPGAEAHAHQERDVLCW